MLNLFIWLWSHLLIAIFKLNLNIKWVENHRDQLIWLKYLQDKKILQTVINSQTNFNYDSFSKNCTNLNQTEWGWEL